MNIEEFLQYHTQEMRELIDNISSLIFQTHPNIKEKILPRYKGIKFIHPTHGHIIDILTTSETIILKNIKTKCELQITKRYEKQKNEIEKFIQITQK